MFSNKQKLYNRLDGCVEALAQAVECNNPANIEELLRLGADPTVPSLRGWIHSEKWLTPLANALLHNRIHIVRLLMQYNENIFELSQLGMAITSSGATLLHIMDAAPDDDNVDILNKILMTRNVDINARDFWDNTPLHSGSELADNLAEFLKFLVIKGADVNAQNSMGQTPLHVLIEDKTDSSIASKHELIKYLIRHGANVNIKDNLQNTVFHYLSDYRCGRRKRIQNVILHAFRRRQNANEAIRSRNVFGEYTPLFLQQEKTRNPSAKYADRMGNTELHYLAGLRTPWSGYEKEYEEQFYSDLNGPADYGVYNAFGQTPANLWVRSGLYRDCTERMFLKFVFREGIRESFLKKDWRDRNVLHLILSSRANVVRWEDYQRIFELFHEDCRHEVDDFGRTPLHVMILRHLELTFLHAQNVSGEERLTQKDKYGVRPMDEWPSDMTRHLKHFLGNSNPEDTLESEPLRKSMFHHEYGASPGCLSKLIDRALKDLQRQAVRCTSNADELRKLLVKETATDNVWKIWTDLEFAFGDKLSDMSSEMFDAVVSFVDVLVHEIGKVDVRFRGCSILVESGFERTRITFADEFDFNVNLTAIAKMCEVVTSTDDPIGFVRLRKNVGCDEDKDFDELFDGEICMRTTTVNFWFQVALLKTLSSRAFWDRYTSGCLNLDLNQEMEELSPRE